MRAVLIALVAAWLLLGCAGQNPAQPTASNQLSGALANPGTPATPAAQPGSNSSSPQKFSDSPDWKSAYLISSATLDDNAKTALSGFELQRQVLGDGRTNITLKALSAEYSDQNYVLQPGQSLYFIEKFLADDSSGRDLNLHDDTAVVVDADGYIVK